MNKRTICLWTALGGLGGGLGLLALLNAQTLPQFTRVERLTNQEIALTLSTPSNLNYRLATASNLTAWSALATLPPGPGSLQHTDAAAPYLSQRFYRAEQLAGTNALTGDHLATTNGDVVIHPMNHATFVMSWNGKMIYNDPVAAAGPYTSLPKADLILISHSHSDHYSNTTLDAVRGTGAMIIAPQAVYNSMTTALKALTTVLTNGTSTNLMGLTVEAVPAYNATYHPRPTCNGYVVTLGGKRIYISGDTGDVAETRALPNIDVAFVCMNTPYTMTVSEAITSVRAYRPKVVYPYHYRNLAGNATTNAAYFKRQLGTDLGIEVRLRKWY